MGGFQVSLELSGQLCLRPPPAHPRGAFWASGLQSPDRRLAVGGCGRQPSMAALWRVPAPEWGRGGDGALTGPTVSSGALDLFACTTLTVFVFVFIIDMF